MFIVKSEIENKNVDNINYKDALRLGYQMFNNINMKVNKVKSKPRVEKKVN